MTARFWRRHFVYWIFLIASLLISVFGWMHSKQLQRQSQLPYLAGIITDTRFTEYEIPEGVKRKRMVAHRDFFFQLKDQPNRLLRLNKLKASEWRAFEKEIKHKHAMRLQYEQVILEGEQQYIIVINAENEHWQLKDLKFKSIFFMCVSGMAGLVLYGYYYY